MFFLFTNNWFDQIFPLLLKKKSPLTTTSWRRYVSISVLFLFFWLPPFIPFNTELVYNVKTIMLLCHFYQGRIEMTVMGCGCLLVASLSLLFWTINKLVRAADQDRRSKRFCSNALRTFHLTEPGSGLRNRNVEVMELRFAHSIHS